MPACCLHVAVCESVYYVAQRRAYIVIPYTHTIRIVVYVFFFVCMCVKPECLFVKGHRVMWPVSASQTINNKKMLRTFAAMQPGILQY